MRYLACVSQSYTIKSLPCSLNWILNNITVTYLFVCVCVCVCVFLFGVQTKDHVDLAPLAILPYALYIDNVSI